MDDPYDFLLAVNKDHIQKEWGIFHPECLHRFGGEDERHTVVLGQGLAVHQADASLFGGLCKVYRNSDGPGGRIEVHRRGGSGRRGRGERIVATAAGEQ